jgi:2',3'-cyclic-nucleotide 2'-phosphodiesterase (5'-nucleotidase family)
LLTQFGIVKQISDLERLPNYNQIIPSPKMLKILRTTHSKIEKEVAHPLLRTEVPLDGRTHIIRSQETNLGNMLADAVRCFYETDIAVVNSGAIRCDRIIECVDGSPLCIRDLIEISPFDNVFVVKRVSGRVLTQALENSVSDAHTDGRFLQLSGLRIAIDWRLPEGRRVSKIYFDPSQSRRTPLESQRMYTVAMVDFIGSGFDGYSCFQGAETLVDAEGGITDTNMLLQIFESGGSNEGKGEVAGDHRDGVKRARAAIIRGYHEADGLPTISPMLEGRINVINGSNL